jgi:hypothetical protein
MYLALKKNMRFRILIMMIMNSVYRNFWIENLKPSKLRKFSYGFLKQMKFTFSEMRLFSTEIRMRARDSIFISQI